VTVFKNVRCGVDHHKTIISDSHDLWSRDTSIRRST